MIADIAVTNAHNSPLEPMTPNRNSTPRRTKRAARARAAVPGDDAVRKRVGLALLSWYAEHRRELPWRKRDDPYAIWVSEVMLQQTQVATAGPYYERWMRRFPTLAALAKAPEQEVLGAWAGLGYYSRARALHAGAKLVCEDGGRLPQTADELRQLPGIGPYTAGAIASIAYGHDEPAVDGNVVRVLTRLFALGGAPQRNPLKDQLWELARALIPAGRAGDFNQALMELGALCCTPKRPLCDRCPVAAVCRAHAAGEVTRYPELPPRPKTTLETHVALAALRKGRVLIAQLPQSAPRWSGMWVFPMTKVEAGEDAAAAASRALHEFAGVRAEGVAEADSIVHSVTRYRITLRLFCGRARGRTRETDAALRWVNAHELAELPMPAAQRKLAQRLKLADD